MAQKKSKTWIWILIFAIIILIFAFNYGFKTRTYYIADQVPTDFEEVSDGLTDEERAYYENRVIFEANYYSNENENGVQLQELRLNYFTDPSLSTIATRGTGMQYKGDYKLKDNQVSSKEEASEFRPDDLYYYDTTATNGDVISWDGGKVATNLNRKTSLIVKIDDKPYLLKLTAKKETKWLDWILIETYYYGYDDVFVDIMQAIKTNSKKAGDYYITLDLSFYFTVHAYDELSGKWNDENIAKEVLTYSVLKFHYDEDGAQTTEDSIFGVIENDSEFDIRPITINYHSNDNQNLLYTETYNYKTSNVELNYNKFVSNGMAISGWKTQSDDSGITYKLGQTMTVEKGQVIDLYAVYEALEYTFLFGNGYRKDYESITFKSGIPQVIPEFNFELKSGDVYLYGYRPWFEPNVKFYINSGDELTVTLKERKYSEGHILELSCNNQLLEVYYDFAMLDDSDYYDHYLFTPEYRPTADWTGIYSFKSVELEKGDLEYLNTDYIKLNGNEFEEVCFNGVIYSDFVDMYIHSTGVICSLSDYSINFVFLINEETLYFEFCPGDGKYIRFIVEKS